MKAIYLQKSLSVNGRDSLRGRRLLDKFREGADECLLGHVIVDNEFYANWKEEESRRDLISYDMLRDVSPDLIYLEGGMLASKDMWKIPKDLASQVATSGTVLFINDIDINDLRSHHAALQGVFAFSGASVQLHNSSPVYAAGRRCSPAELHLTPEKMVIADWLRPVYCDVDSIVVSWAMRLSHWGNLLASANQGEHGTLASDTWVDESDCCPFASVRQIGNGFVVMIAAITTPWTEEHDGTLRWLLNTSHLLCEAAKANRERSVSFRHSRHSLFLSHRSTDKTIVDEVALGIKRGGVGIWYDKDKLIPSDSLTEAVGSGIADMTHFVLFWSNACKDSAWVNRELNSAISRVIEHKTPMIIVRLDETPVPQLVADLYRIEANGLSTSQIAEILVTTVNRLAQRSGHNADT